MGWLYSDQGLEFKGANTKPDTKFLTCRWADVPTARTAIAPPFVLRVAVKEASGSRRLLILPPLKLHNLLSGDMHYRYVCFLRCMCWMIVGGRRELNPSATSCCTQCVRCGDEEVRKRDDERNA